MNKNETVEEFFNNNKHKINIFKSKYLQNNETVYQCFKHIADEISCAYFDLNSKEQIYWSEKWIDDMMHDRFRPGGSIIAGTNNKTKKISLFNCTGFKIPFDTLEAIYDTRYKVSKCAAHRQGCGIDFSNLRYKNSTVNNSAEFSEGAISWMKSFDRIASEVGQRGRIPAMLFSLKIDHPDIIDFISCKDNLDTINNANISIQITDKFMECVKNDEQWCMSFGIYTKMISARKLLRMIASHSHISAEPGILFIDRMKDGSMQESFGYTIETCNACSEKSLPNAGVCCLSSINMAKVPHIKSRNFKKYIEDITKSLVVFMDNVNEYEIKNSFKSPIQEQLDIVKDLREIGIGVTNVHQWLYDQNFEYDCDDAINALEDFFKWYYYYTFKASAELAKVRGACSAWERNLVSSDTSKKTFKNPPTKFLSNIFKEFPDLEEMYNETGIRNGSLLSIAPTGTLSLTFRDDVLSTGIEPLIGRAYWQKTRANTKGNYYEYYFKIPDTVKNLVLKKMKEIIKKDELFEIDKVQEDYQILSNFINGTLDKDGIIGKTLIKIIDKYVPKKLLKSSHEIDPFKKIEMMGKIQKYIDSAISVTFNLSKDFTVEQVEQLYIKAHEAGLKGLSIYRDGSREGIMIFEFPKTPKDRKIKISEIDKNRPEKIVIQHAPIRSNKLKCEIFKALKHYVLIGLLDDTPYECFIVDTEIKLPSKGYIIKKSKKKYALTDIDDNVIIDNIIDRELINDEIKIISRLTSSNLRHGTPINFIINQLDTCNGEDKYPKVIAKVLKKYNRLILDVISNDKKCVVCGEILVKYGGCMTCVNCDFSGCEI